MAGQNKSFYVHNGLVVASQLTVDSTGNLYTPGIITSTIHIITSSTGVSSTNTGALQVAGGIGVGGGAFFGGVVTATNMFIGPWAVSTGSSVSTATSASTLATILQTTSATFYPTFVNTNPSSPTYLSHYTTASFSINPATGVLSATQISISSLSVALGSGAGLNTQSNYAIAIGVNAGQNSQANSAIAIGQGTGIFGQSSSAIAIGNGAGSSSQGSSAVAIGVNAGSGSQGTNAIAIGYRAGYTGQLTQSIAMGYNAGYTGQGNYAVALGYFAGYSTQSGYAVAIGDGAGQNSQGFASVALGYQAALNNQGQVSVAIGELAGNTSQGQYAIAIGGSSAQNTQSNYAVAIGYNAGQLLQGVGAVSIGTSAGLNTQSNYAVALGYNAGQYNQGAYSIAIGDLAGQNYQPANSIVLNASGSVLNGATASSFYVSPIRTDASTSGTTWSLYYNPVTKEITTATLGSFNGGTVTSATTFNSTVTIASSAISTSTNTGALQVAGGVGIGGNLYVGGKVVANELDIQYTTVTTQIIVTPDVFTITNTTNASSTITGALVVSGGAGLGGNLYVGGTVVGGGVRSTSTSTAPANPTVGDYWYNTLTDDIYRYTTDGVSSYWLDVTGATVSTQSPFYGVTPNFVKYTRTTQQTGTISAGTVVICNVLENIAGSDISVNTSTGQVTLAAGKTYRLRGSIPGATGSAGSIEYTWYNETASAYIGESGEMYSPTNSAGYLTTGGPAETVITTTVTTVVSFRVQSASSITALGGNTDFGTAGSYPWIDVEEISGQAAISAVNTPAMNITNSTTATSTNTGALQVAGGAGIGGNIYAGGSVLAAGSSGPQLRFEWDTWLTNGTTALSAMSPPGALNGSAVFDGTIGYGIDLTTNSGSQSGSVYWNSSNVNYNNNMILSGSFAGAGGTAADGYGIFFGSSAAISSASYGSTNGILVFCHYYNGVNRWEVYVNGTQNNYPFIPTSTNYTPSGITVWSTSTGSAIFNTISVQINSYSNKRLLDVYLNSAHQLTQDITSWTPSGNYFGATSYTGGSYAYNYVRSLKVWW